MSDLILERELVGISLAFLNFNSANQTAILQDTLVQSNLQYFLPEKPFGSGSFADKLVAGVGIVLGTVSTIIYVSLNTFWALQSEKELADESQANDREKARYENIQYTRYLKLKSYTIKYSIRHGIIAGVLYLIWVLTGSALLGDVQINSTTWAIDLEKTDYSLIVRYFISGILFGISGYAAITANLLRNFSLSFIEDWLFRHNPRKILHDISKAQDYYIEKIQQEFLSRYNMDLDSQILIDKIEYWHSFSALSKMDTSDIKLITQDIKDSNDSFISLRFALNKFGVSRWEEIIKGKPLNL